MSLSSTRNLCVNSYNSRYTVSNSRKCHKFLNSTQHRKQLLLIWIPYQNDKWNPYGQKFQCLPFCLSICMSRPITLIWQTSKSERVTAFYIRNYYTITQFMLFVPSNCTQPIWYNRRTKRKDIPLLPQVVQSLSPLTKCPAKSSAD